MANIDWIKIKQALLSHEWIALMVFAWLLSIPLYIMLQTWFGYAWVGRWRIAALIPLIGLVVLTLIFFIGESYYPEHFGPPAENPFDNPILAVIFFSPLGVIYLVIAGIAHRGRSRPTAT